MSACSHKGVDLCVMTYNTMLTTPEIIRHNGQRQRSARIPRCIALFEEDNNVSIDVVVLTEAIDPASTRRLLSGFVREGWRYQTRPVQRTSFLQDWPPKLLPGGVYVVSKHPILQESSLVFQDACVDEDCLVSKGCVLAKIHVMAEGPPANKPAFVFNVMGTHMQAWDTKETNKVRDRQVMQIREFLKESEEEGFLCGQQPLVLAGDFNVDIYGSNAVFDKLEAALGVQHVSVLDTVMANPGSVAPVQASVLEDTRTVTVHRTDARKEWDKYDLDQQVPAGTQKQVPAFATPLMYFSADPQLNTLVGNDLVKGYRMQEFPEGCYEKYMETMQCPCCPQELLDHVFYSKKYLLPSVNPMPTARVVPLKAESPFLMNFNLTTKRTTSDLSDHFPVVARMRFRLEGPNFEAPLRPISQQQVTDYFSVLAPKTFANKAPRRGQRRIHPNFTAVFGAVVLAVAVLLCAVLGARRKKKFAFF